MSMNYSDIGLRIKRYRLDKGWSQEELAEALAISLGHINKIENGKRYPSLELLVSIANVLDVTADDLLTGSLVKSSSTAGSEIHRLLLECNVAETKMLTRTLEFLKALLFEFGI